jgi:hypothetical protein
LTPSANKSLLACSTFSKTNVLSPTALIASALISLLLYALRGLGIQWVLFIFALGLIILLTSLISVKLTGMIYLGMTLMVMPIGLAVSSILMAAFYFLLLTPLGLLFRLIRRYPLHRRFDANAKSHWMPHQSHNDPERYSRQF